MKRFDRVASLALACSLAACSGSSSGAVTPKPTASPATNEPTVDVGVALSRLALGALQADAEIGLLAGPNHFSMVANPTTAFAPVCDASSASAQSVTMEVNATIAVVRTAIYPPGDLLCAMAPEAIAVIGYPAGTAFPRIGYGYVVDYALSPLASIAVANGFAPESQAVYVAQQDASTTDFVTNVDATIPSLPAQPGAGSFPQTFPAVFNDASTMIGAEISSTGIELLAPGNYYAVRAAASGTNGASLAASWFPFGPITAGTPTGNSYAVADQATFAFSSSSSATSTLSIGNPSPSYAISRSASDPARLLSPFPLPAGQVGFTVGTLTTLGQTSNAKNFSTVPVNTATLRSDGTIAASHQTYTDTVNGVSADLASTDGVTFTLTLTDTLNKTALTDPATIALTPAGGGPYCTFAYTLFPFGTTPRYTDELVNYSCPSQ